MNISHLLRINWYRPPIMSQNLKRLCNLFMEIQKPYAKHCPDDRVNF